VVIGVICLILLLLYATVCLTFFFTGGGYVLARTALNNKMDAHLKLRWMIAQVYFPLFTFGYLISFERDMRHRLMGAIVLCIACLTPVTIVRHVSFDRIGGVSADFVRFVQTGGSQKHGAANKKVENINQHADEAGLLEKVKILEQKLDHSQAPTPEENARMASVGKTLQTLQRAYIEGAVPENAFAEVIDNLSQITANGSLSADDARVWAVLAGQSFSRQNTATTAPDPGKRQGYHDYLSKVDARFAALHRQADAYADKREELIVMQEAVWAMQSRYDRGEISESDLASFISNVVNMINVGIPSPQDYSVFLDALGKKLTAPCSFCVQPEEAHK
jgi:hypothetical protein